tara:strand:+ start:18877 stop:19641 length:765 start_codon:yes stop_codon:yes gene_type:complete
LKTSDLKAFLEEKVVRYNHPKFIATDPIQIPHRFQQKEAVEIAGFLTATIAWGNRKSIITNAEKMMQRMGNDPYDFVMQYDASQSHHLEGFVHRTFNSIDLDYFIKALQRIYRDHEGMEAVFARYATTHSVQPAIHEFKKLFFAVPHPSRTQKHISDPAKNSAAKRINMFLRWMVRNDAAGVDFGIWKELSPSQLSCPLDVHSGNIARKLKLLKRKQNDGKAVVELDAALRKFDPKDPVKYDFALFGLGAMEDF